MKEIVEYIQEKLVISRSSSISKYLKKYKREIDGIPEDVIKNIESVTENDEERYKIAKFYADAFNTGDHFVIDKNIFIEYTENHYNCYEKLNKSTSKYLGSYPIEDVPLELIKKLKWIKS